MQSVEKHKKYDLYESYFTCHFFRLWGQNEMLLAQKLFGPEGPTNLPGQAVLLGNMQNFLDEAYGDVSGCVGKRYFVIEFKRERKGILAEVTSKLHRKELHTKLQAENTCLALSKKGHFAGYPDKLGLLRFEPYYQAITPADELSEDAKILDFETFFTKLVCSGPALNKKSPPGFAKGLGLTREQMDEYVKCMYSHLKPVKVSSKGKNPQETVMLGVYDEKSKTTSGFVEDFSTLLAHLHERIEKAEAQLRGASALKANDKFEASDRNNLATGSISGKGAKKKS